MLKNLSVTLYSTNTDADYVLSNYVHNENHSFNAPDDFSVEPVDRDPNRWTVTTPDVTDLWRLFEHLTSDSSTLKEMLDTFEFSVNNF